MTTLASLYVALILVKFALTLVAVAKACFGQIDEDEAPIAIALAAGLCLSGMVPGLCCVAIAWGAFINGNR